jgi:hypothetical protein
MRNGGQTLPQAAAQLKPAGPAEHMGTVANKVGIKYSNILWGSLQIWTRSSGKGGIGASPGTHHTLETNKQIF